MPRVPKKCHRQNGKSFCEHLPSFLPEKRAPPTIGWMPSNGMGIAVFLVARDTLPGVCFKLKDDAESSQYGARRSGIKDIVCSMPAAVVCTNSECKALLGTFHEQQSDECQRVFCEGCYADHEERDHGRNRQVERLIRQKRDVTLSHHGRSTTADSWCTSCISAIALVLWCRVPLQKLY